MRQRIAAAATSLALAVLLLVNFRGPQDIAISGVAPSTIPGSDRATGRTPTAGGTASRTTTGIRSNGTFGATGSSGSAGFSRVGPTATGAPAQFVGPLAADPYGDVQVQITVQAGKIVDLVALALPVGGHSGRISDFVAPLLRKQALAAQSANIDGVSGATYTSRAYAASLQGALDKAGL